MVRILGSHPSDPGSNPGNGSSRVTKDYLFLFYTFSLLFSFFGVDGRTVSSVGLDGSWQLSVSTDVKEGSSLNFRFRALSYSRILSGWMETEESWRIVSADVNRKFGFIVARRWRLKSGTLAISDSVSTEVAKVRAIVVSHRRRRHWRASEVKNVLASFAKKAPVDRSRILRRWKRTKVARSISLAVVLLRTRQCGNRQNAHLDKWQQTREIRCLCKGFVPASIIRCCLLSELWRVSSWQIASKHFDQDWVGFVSSVVECFLYPCLSGKLLGAKDGGFKGGHRRHSGAEGWSSAQQADGSSPQPKCKDRYGAIGQAISNGT